MSEHNVPQRDSVALLTVDLQRDFTRRGSPIMASGVGRALPNICQLVEAFREGGRPIFHSIRLYRPDGSNVDLCRRSQVEEGLRVLMPGTSGVELLDAVRPDGDFRVDSEALIEGEFQEIGPNERLVYKPRWGAFFSTELEAWLHRLSVNTVVVCGFNFPTGGRASIYEACARDFRVVVGTDALCDASEEGLRELGRLGAYQMTTAACLDWLRGKRQPSAA
jgi:nicotinamidase-related amidase